LFLGNWIACKVLRLSIPLLAFYTLASDIFYPCSYIFPRWFGNMYPLIFFFSFRWNC